jgi:hypothetical protein
LLSAHPKAANEFEVIRLGLNFRIAAVGRAPGREVFEYFDKTESKRIRCELSRRQGGYYGQLAGLFSERKRVIDHSSIARVGRPRPTWSIEAAEPLTSK